MSRKPLTPEQIILRDAERASKKQALVAAKAEVRRAEVAARAAAYHAKIETDRAAFIAALDADLIDFQEAIKPVGNKECPFSGKVVPEYSSEFVESLANQYASRGQLSPAQLSYLLKGYRKSIETKELVATWLPLAVGDYIEELVRIMKIERSINSYTNQECMKISFTTRYGRPCHFKTNSKKILAVAHANLDANTPVIIKGKVSFIPPDGKLAVLSSKGIEFRDLMG